MGSSLTLDRVYAVLRLRKYGSAAECGFGRGDHYVGLQPKCFTATKASTRFSIS